MNPTQPPHFEYSISVDHTLFSTSTQPLSSIDHQYLRPAVGPFRTPRARSRTSPYSSPVHSPPSSPSELFNTPHCAYESDSDTGFSKPSALLYPARGGRVLAYDSDDDFIPGQRTDRRSVHNASIAQATRVAATPAPSHSRRVYAYDSDDSQQQTKKGVSFAQAIHSTNSNKVNARDADRNTRASESIQAAASLSLPTGSNVSLPTATVEASKRGAPKLPLFLDSDSDDSDNDDKISKPTGEAGRPGRGGYNLRAVLKWPDEKHDKVKKYINGIVQDKLDCSVPYTEQPLLALKQVRELAAVRYPFLSQYRDNWATDDFIRAQLKYRKAALQKDAVESELAEIRTRATKSSKRTGRKSNRHAQA